MTVFQRVRALCSAGLIAFGFVGMAAAAIPGQAPVEVIPITGPVDQGTVQLVSRALTQARARDAAAIVLDINSTAGLTASALQIRDALLSAKAPVYAYVEHRAYAAAALVALAASRIVLAPDASIGAAEPMPDTAQNVAALRAAFTSTALRNHRDGTIAAAMVDKGVNTPAYKLPGTILTLDASDALRSHIADATAPTLDAMLATDHLSTAPVVTATYSLGEQVARLATNPIVSGLLLTLGMLGLLVEMQTLHGVAGIVGVSALALFFGAHIYDGFSGGIVVLLALAGLLGILWELHVVPGHGAPGILGAIALFCAVLWAFGFPLLFVGIETISTSIVLTVILFAVAARAFPENAWMNKLMLRADQGPDYVTSSDFSDLLGASGTAASYLRPSGVASFDGRRIDVLTEGEFIAQGTPIRVTRVQGARIFVEPVHLPSYQ
ncbi:MAG: NfeD family protein [Vulcanimicrobiaceae bacterium]